MSGEKLSLAKSSVLSLIDSLDDTHFMTFISFDSEAHLFSSSSSESYGDDISQSIVSNLRSHNNSSESPINAHLGGSFTLPCTNDTYIAVSEYFDSFNGTYGTTANITRAIEAAIQMDEYVWSDSVIPENALSMIILLTDGRSASGNSSEMIGKEIRVLNKIAKIPIFSIGIGFDANMEFLEDVAGLFYLLCII